MDEQLKTGIDIFLTERHGYVISKLRRENDGHIALVEKIRQTQQKLYTAVSNETWQSIRELLALLLLEKDCENMFSYVNGLCDSMSLWQYFDGEFLNSNYIDLHPDIEFTYNGEMESEDCT